MTITLFSPAKINLFLRILGKRSDGYHNLASLFHTIQYGDIVTLSLAQEDKIFCDHPDVPLDSTNLAWKALDLFRKKTGLSFCAHIDIQKKIPPGSGLGGGSSNAATTLWGLNALHSFSYPEEDLKTWSLELGSDVPFFFSSGTAYCTGRGEQVMEMPQLLFLPSIYLFTPSFGVSTKLIFSKFHLQFCSKIDPNELLESFKTETPHFHNDLETVAIVNIPSLKNFKLSLQEEFQSVSMTGSGSSFICTKPQKFLSFENKIPLMRRLKPEWYC